MSALELWSLGSTLNCVFWYALIPVLVIGFWCVLHLNYGDPGWTKKTSSVYCEKDKDSN